MRLWHEKLIPLLPRQQLLGQHRECCALRGGEWGMKHATVDYVFKHPYGWLVAYHKIVMDEMIERCYTPNYFWHDTSYRGAYCEAFYGMESEKIDYDYTTKLMLRELMGETIYPEHNDEYLQECIDNLARKGITINMEDVK